MVNKRCMSCFQEFEGSACPHCGGAQNDAHQLPVGTVLHGRYQIGKVLGQGGFGITYIGWDRLNNSTIAVKEFYPGGIVFRKSTVSTNVECINSSLIPHYNHSKARFLQEANALAKFRSVPEIVNILDFSEENNTAYIIMEYVRGVNLAKYIQLRGGKLSAEETFRILRPVMEALAKVHSSGIVHRDISPDNIILDPMGGAKLLDFGAVRAVEDPDVEKALTQSTVAILKHGFAPIEQYNSRGSLGPWTDEYAMCATIWYCLTGNVPEEAPVRMSEGINPNWNTIPGLSERQRMALAKGFSCRAKDRYKNIDALLDALFPGSKQEKHVMPTKTPKHSPEPRNFGWNLPVNKKTLVICVSAAVIILIISFLLFLPSKQDAKPNRLRDNHETRPENYSETTLPTEEPLPSDNPEPSTVPLSEEEMLYLQAEQLLTENRLGEAAIAFGKLAGYLDARERSLEIWDQIAVRDTVAAGEHHTVGIREDGTLVYAGPDIYGLNKVSEITDAIAVSARNNYTVVLFKNGTVDVLGQEPYDHRKIDKWTDIVAISAGWQHVVGLKLDGTIVTVGPNHAGEEAADQWADIVAISAGDAFTVGIKSDGSVVAVGSNAKGQCNVDTWSDITKISAGHRHVIGIKKDGTIVTAGDNNNGQISVTDWTGIIAFSTHYHTLGLMSDRTVKATGYTIQGQCNIPDWTDVVAIIAGGTHTICIHSDGTLSAVGGLKGTNHGQLNVSGWRDIRIPSYPTPFR